MLRPYAPGSEDESPARVPSLAAALWRQRLLLREPLRRFAARRRLAAGAPVGERGAVLVFPGMGVGDLSTRTLRRYLRQRGFDARGWGPGRNRPNVPRNLARQLVRLEAFAEERGESVALVGWSLGGILARELARLRPDLVRHVVTLGAPVREGLRATAIGGLFRLQRWDLDEVASLLAAADATPIRVPVTAIFSRRDGIVAWQVCIDRTTPEVVHLEASSCHWGLGLDPEVLEAVAARLAPR